MRISDAERSVEKWIELKYGRGNKNIPATIRKFHEEVGELIEAVMNNDCYNAAIEAADVFILLCTLNSNMEYMSLEEAIKEKLNIIYKRLDDETKSSLTGG